MSDISIGATPEPFSFLQPGSAGGSAQRPSYAGGASSDDPAPRLVIRGETLIGKPSAIIDWLTFTVRANEGHSPDSLCSFLVEAIQDRSLNLVKMNRGACGYKHSAVIRLSAAGESAHSGIIAWGGHSQKGTIFVSLPATFCARVTSWAFVEKTLFDCDATITRVDLAHDDVDGKMPIIEALQKYELGEFNAGG